MYTECNEQLSCICIEHKLLSSFWSPFVESILYYDSMQTLHIICRPLPICIPQEVLTILKIRLVARIISLQFSKKGSWAIWVVHLTLAQDKTEYTGGVCMQKFI